jgi:DNA-binding IclR family transcriptional regulator
MAYVEHGMWEVLEVLRRAHRGEGRNSIARSSGEARKTVRRCMSKAADLGWVPGC